MINDKTYHRGYITIGNTGGIMNYCRGYFDDFNPPWWNYNYSTGSLTNNQDNAILSIGVFSPAAGTYYGVVATQQSHYSETGTVIVDGVEYTTNDSHALYTKFRELEGQTKLIYWTE